MKVRRILAGMGALLGTFALMVASPTAGRADAGGISDAISFSGATSALTPPVMSSGGSGSFTFGSDVCRGVSDVQDNDLPALSEQGPCSFTATGTYANMVCGTGTADGTAAVVTVEGTFNVSFHIAFTAGTGVISGTVTSNPGAAAGDDDTGGTVSGDVVLTPTGGNCVTGVTQFRATGHAEVHEPPGGGS